MLCDECREIFERWMAPDLFSKRYPEADCCAFHHKNLKSLFSAADSRCYICFCFVARLLEIRPRQYWENKSLETSVWVGKWEPWPHEINEQQSSNEDSKTVVPHFKLEVTLDDGYEELGEFEDFADDGELSPLFLEAFARRTFFLYPQRKLGRIVFDDESKRSSDFSRVLEFTTACREMCERDCKFCNVGNSYTDATTYPSRLVDIGHSGSVTWRVVDPKEEGIAAQKYMTLSHVWNHNTKEQTLTLKALSSMKQGLPFDILPDQYQRAACISQLFGIRYLWIDSLCIIQDSLEDWEGESPKMCSYYANSYLNLAALTPTVGVSDSNDSNVCRLMHPVVLQRRGRLPEEYCLVSSEFAESSLLKHPFFHRGWIFQERALSNSILYFGREQLFWQCNGITASETFPSGCNLFNAYGIPKPQVSNESNSTTRDNQISSRRVDWYRAMHFYSGCKLTFESDKLAAVAGLAYAESKAQYRYDEYVAGLWKTELLRGCAWHCNRDFQRYKQSSPSWTWATVKNAKVWFPDSANILYPLVKNICTERTDYLGKPLANPTPSSHTLKLRGLLFPAKLKMAEDEDEEDEELGDGEDSVACESLKFHDIAELSSKYEETRGEPENIFLLPWCLERDQEGFTCFNFLIIARNHDSTYTRVGQTSAVRVYHDESSLERLRNLLFYCGFSKESSEFLLNSDIEAFEKSLKREPALLDDILQHMKMISIV